MTENAAALSPRSRTPAHRAPTRNFYRAPHRLPGRGFRVLHHRRRHQALPLLQVHYLRLGQNPRRHHSPCARKLLQRDHPPHSPRGKPSHERRPRTGGLLHGNDQRTHPRKHRLHARSRHRARCPGGLRPQHLRRDTDHPHTPRARRRGGRISRRIRGVYLAGHPAHHGRYPAGRLHGGAAPATAYHALGQLVLHGILER